MFSISYKQRARLVSPRALFRYFQMNSLPNLMVFTLKKGYARNVLIFHNLTLLHISMPSVLFILNSTFTTYDEDMIF